MAISDMSNLLKLILQSLRASNYLSGKFILVQNEEICQISLLKNGLKLRQLLLEEWSHMSTTRTIQYGNIQQIEGNIAEGMGNRTSFLQCGAFQKAYERIYKAKLVNLSNSIAVKTICNNKSNFVVKNHFFCTEATTLLVTDIFVPAEIELSKYYNLQRERKIWWMRFSANPSRYWVEPFNFCPEEESCNEIHKKSKSITIKGNLTYGSADMESISLVPLYKLDSLNFPFTDDSCNVSLIRSVINLDLATSALILDASLSRTKCNNNTLMLNRKLAPYQVLIANLHKGNKLVDELSLHLKYVLGRSGLRLYDDYIHTKTQLELEEDLMQFDSLGIPYTLVVDDESIKSGKIKLRSRDTTLFETIHISDIPNYLLYIFKQ